MWIMAQFLDIDLLRTFHTVARLGRFKDAAAHLGKSTSAVSVHIQRLERIVGDRLFERDNQRSELSERGRQLLRETSGFLAEHDRIMAAMTEEPVNGKVRLGIPEEYAAAFLKQCLPLFAMENPGVELEVEAASSETLAGLYEKARLDVAVTVCPADEASRHVTLSEVTPVWAVSQDMRVLSLSPLPVALHAKGCPYRGIAIAALKRSGRAWRTVLSSGNSAAITAAIEGGMVVAIVGRSQLSSTMAVVPEAYNLPDLEPCRIVYCSRKESQAESRLGIAIAKYFEASAR